MPRDLYLDLPLPVELRMKLHDVGFTDVHQSGLAEWAECHAMLGFHLQAKKVVHEAPLLLGSVMHSALSDPHLKDDGWEVDYWLEKFAQVKAADFARSGLANPADITYHLNGQLLTKKDIVRWSCDFVSAVQTGILLPKILLEVKQEIEDAGLQIADQEFPLSFSVGGEYPIRFHGTLDLILLDQEGNLGIADFKMSGLIGAYTKGDVPNKVSFDPEQILFHRQLRHYHWMFRRVAPDQKPRFYGIVAPTNRFPYKVGPNKGSPKGSCLFMGPAMDDYFVADYESMVLDQLRWIGEGNFTKLLPSTFGKPSCPRCRYFKVCMNDPTASKVAGSSEFDFLRQPQE